MNENQQKAENNIQVKAEKYMDILTLIIGMAVGIALGIVIYRFLGPKKDTESQIRLALMTEQLGSTKQELQDIEARFENLQQENAALKTTLEHERRAIAEKIELLNKAKEEMSHTFKSISQDVMAANRENFLALAQERFKQFQNTAETDLEKRQKAIKELIEPVSKSLETMDKKIIDLEKAREGAYGELREHLSAMKADQGKLRLETASLVQALRSPSARGQWGELQLIRTLEMAGMVEGVHYKQQVTTSDGTRPDVIVYLPGGQNIVIDAKSPIDAYLDSLKEGIDELSRTTQLDRHARHVREHFKMLGSKKYWSQFDTPEFVVMFLPGESYFSAALERDPGLIEAGVDSKVIPATPTTLIAMLRAVAYGWRQEALAANAKEISELGQDLYKKLSVFGDHMARVGRGLDTAMTSYNKAVGSLENNVLRTARKFTELQATPDKAELPDLKALEDTPRKLTAVEFDRSEKQEG